MSVWGTGNLQERGVQSTGCSAWRWGLCCKGSPALLQQTRPTLAEHTAPSHRPHHTHTGHFHEIWREREREDGMEGGGRGWRKIDKRARVRSRKEEEIEEESSEENSFTLKAQSILLVRLKEVIATLVPVSEWWMREGWMQKTKLLSHIGDGEDDAKWTRVEEGREEQANDFLYARFLCVCYLLIKLKYFWRYPGSTWVLHNSSWVRG